MELVEDHPARYLLQCQGPRVDSQQAAFAAAGERAAEAVRAVLRSYGLAEPDISTAHQVFRSGIHGLVHLEANDALGPGADRVFEAFVDFFAVGLKTMSEHEES